MTRTRTLTAFAATLVLCALLSVPARAATTISLTILPNAGVWGTTFGLRGFTGANTDVKLQRRTVGRTTWGDIGGIKTSDSNGWYIFYDSPSASSEYRSIVVSDGSTSGVVRGNIAVGVHIAVASTTGGSALFTGKVLPAHPGTRVLLQMYDGVEKRWNTVSRATLSSTSRYRITFRSTGRRLFRTAWPTQHIDHQWNVSAHVWVNWTRG